MPKIITMATLKGGAGKTMNAFNIAGILAEEHRILLIDVDPQANLSSNCGVDITDPDTYSIKDVFDNGPKSQPSPKDIIIPVPIPELRSLDIIPSSIYLFESEESLYLKPDRERVLEKYFKRHEKTFAEYDYVIIDTNPSMSLFNINAFLIADEIILSCDVSKNSITGAEIFCALWDKKREQLDKDDNIAALIISNYSGQNNLARDLKAFTHDKDFSKDIVLDNLINTTVRLKETEIRHKPVNILYPKHRASEQYRAVVNELYEREVL